VGDPTRSNATAGQLEFERLIDEVFEMLAEVARFEDPW
jgi:creatinine amidohydrolase/Fe(II)-dependent formamide hydrolase-like protein